MGLRIKTHLISVSREERVGREKGRERERKGEEKGRKKSNDIQAGSNPPQACRWAFAGPLVASRAQGVLSRIDT
jgi:hypothetical protein